MKGSIKNKRPSQLSKYLMLLFCCTLILLLGCSTPQQRYHVLKFFFDGVPNPDAIDLDLDAAGGGGRSRVPRKIASKHRPYAEKNCKPCHGDRNKNTLVRAPAPTICMKCHQALVTEFPWMHGPVASGNCLWCHDPHQSFYPHLLRRPGRALCNKCHTPESFTEIDLPAHLDKKQSCLKCHVGHGSKKRFLLRKPKASTPAPSDSLKLNSEQSNNELENNKLKNTASKSTTPQNSTIQKDQTNTGAKP